MQIKSMLLGELRPYAADADSNYFFVDKDLERWKYFLDTMESGLGTANSWALREISN